MRGGDDSSDGLACVGTCGRSRYSLFPFVGGRVRVGMLTFVCSQRASGVMMGRAEERGGEEKDAGGIKGLAT